MKLLTESKIRELFRTTNLKYSKELTIEKNTIITPAAKSYLNDKRIKLIEANSSELQVHQVHVEESNKNTESLSENLLLNPKRMLVAIKVDKLIVQAIILQKECLNNQKLLGKIGSLIAILSHVKHALVIEEELEVNKEDIEGFYQENINLLALFESDNYPDYTENYLTLRLFEFYIDIKTTIYELMVSDDRFQSYAWQKYLQWIIDSSLAVYLIEKSKGGM